MKKVIISLLISLFTLAGYAQTTEYLPVNKDEVFLHIESEKDGRTNAAILCVKSEIHCLDGKVKLPIRDFVKKKGFKGLYEHNPKIIDGVSYFVLFVWK